MRWTPGRCWSVLVEHPSAVRDMGMRCLGWLSPCGDTCGESEHARGCAGTGTGWLSQHCRPVGVQPLSPERWDYPVNPMHHLIVDHTPELMAIHAGGKHRAAGEGSVSLGAACSSTARRGTPLRRLLRSTVLGQRQRGSVSPTTTT